MIDQFREEAVTRHNQTIPMVMIGMGWVSLVLCGIYGLLMTQNAIYGFGQGAGGGAAVSLVIGLVMIAVAVLIFLFKDRLRTDYEYTFTNGLLDFAAVYNNRKRKALGTMTLKNIQACGMVTSGSFNRYINMPGVKRHNWFANRDGNLFYIYYEKDQEKHIVIMEPSEEMVELIRGAVPRGSYEIN